MTMQKRRDALAHAAVFLGHEEAQEAQFAHLVEGLAGEAAGLVDLGGLGGELFAGELPNHFLHLQVAHRQTKIHDKALFSVIRNPTYRIPSLRGAQRRSNLGVARTEIERARNSPGPEIPHFRCPGCNATYSSVDCSMKGPTSMSTLQQYFDETHDAFRESARTFIAREILPHLDEWEDAELFPKDLYKKAADAGFLGLGYPEEYGGTACDVFHRVALTEEFCRPGSLGLVAGLFSLNIAIPPILALGNESQKQRFAVPVFAGEKIAALGITEPNAGSDVANIQTRAVRQGDYYIVNGAKTFITSGCRADILTTAVRTGGEGAGGISLLVIESNTPGYSVANKIRKMGWDASDTAEIVFQDCKVPVENLLGEEGQGFTGIMRNFQDERLSMAVMAHAAAETAYEEALKYTRERNAFGRPLTGFQVTRHKLVDMLTLVTAAKEFNYRVAAKMEAGEYPVAEVSMAKNFACQVCDKVVYDAVQLHGGYGFAREYKVERLYRDTRILSLGGGTTEIMKEIVAKWLQI
jgi:acyl-CoA dehydrogenase